MLGRSAASKITYVRPVSIPENTSNKGEKLGWIQEGFEGGFSVEAPKPELGPFSGQFGSDSGGLPGCNSDFWPATPTFGL